MGKKSAWGNSSGTIIAYYDSAISPVPSGATNVANLSDAQWQDSMANPGKYQVVNGVLGLAPAPTAAQLSAQAWSTYQAQAQAALSASDMTMHRIGEAVALGSTSWTAADVVAFVQYRRSLRAMLTQAQPGVIPASLPLRPTYPAGT